MAMIALTLVTTVLFISYSYYCVELWAWRELHFGVIAGWIFSLMFTSICWIELWLGYTNECVRYVVA